MRHDIVDNVLPSKPLKENDFIFGDEKAVNDNSYGCVVTIHKSNKKSSRFG
jgi:hypothetical protein